MDDDVLLPDRRHAVAAMFADAFGEARIVGNEFQLRTVDRHDLRKLVERDQAVDEEDFLVVHVELLGHEGPEFRGRLRLHFKPDHRTAAALFQCGLEQPHQIFGLFLDFEVRIPDDAERALPDHLIAGEQTADEQSDRVFQQNEAGRVGLGFRQPDEAGNAGRHAHQRVQRPSVALPLQLQRERKAEIGDERERMRRIDRQRRQYREDVLQEELVEPAVLARGQSAFSDDDDPGLGEVGLQFEPAALLVPGKVADDIVDLFELFERGQSVRADDRHACPDLALETRDADHEELVEIVRGNRQEAQLFEHRMVRVRRFFHDAAVELQPGEFAVDEALGRMPHVDHGRCLFRLHAFARLSVRFIVDLGLHRFHILRLHLARCTTAS